MPMNVVALSSAPPVSCSLTPLLAYVAAHACAPPLLAAATLLMPQLSQSKPACTNVENAGSTIDGGWKPQPPPAADHVTEAARPPASAVTKRLPAADMPTVTSSAVWGVFCVVVIGTLGGCRGGDE